MRITNKPNFILGIFDIIVGTALVIMCIVLHRGSKIINATFPIVLGISLLIISVETKKQRLRRIEKLESKLAKMGVDMDDSEDM